MISIICIVSNDPGIYTTINSLLNHQTKHQFEIIVVSKNFSLDQKKYPQSFLRIIPFKSKKKITIAAQRNVGIRNAKYDATVFIDSGCTPAQGWLDSLFGPTKKGESIVAGPLIANADEVNTITAKKGINNYLEECPTANVLITKQVFQLIGLFDQKFEYGSDVDFMWRARDKGLKIFLSQNSVVTHEMGNRKNQIRRAYYYGRARAQLYCKHISPVRLRYLFTQDLVTLIYPLFLLFLPVTFFFIYYPLLILIPLIKNRSSNSLLVVFYNLVFGFGVLSRLLSIITITSKHSAHLNS